MTCSSAASRSMTTGEHCDKVLAVAKAIQADFLHFAGRPLTSSSTPANSARWTTGLLSAALAPHPGFELLNQLRGGNHRVEAFEGREVLVTDRAERVVQQR